MKKKFKFEGLKCANCANKIEEAISKMDGVEDVKVSYLSEKVKFELADDIDLDNLIEEANKIADKIEPGSRIVVK